MPEILSPTALITPAMLDETVEIELVPEPTESSASESESASTSAPSSTLTASPVVLTATMDSLAHAWTEPDLDVVAALDQGAETQLGSQTFDSATLEKTAALFDLNRSVSGQTLAMTLANLAAAPPLDAEPRTQADESFQEGGRFAIRDALDFEDEDLSGVVMGNYRLVKVIGQGSMGRVYAAQHLALNRPCALKILNPKLAASEPRLRDQFQAEARAAAALAHPNVVTVHNLGREQGLDFIEMEYVTYGVTLRDLIEWHGRLPYLDVTHWMRQVALALAAAHETGMVHRDVKPGNVLLTAKRLAKLADFGLARRQTAEPRETKRGTSVSGTPAYMAPELFGGAPATPQSDFYALGVMYYQLLAGALPFQAERLSDIRELHLNEPAPDVREEVPEVPREVAAIIRHSLAKAPEKRFVDAHELADSLRFAANRNRDVERLIRESLEGVEHVATPVVSDGKPDSATTGRYRVDCRIREDRWRSVEVEVRGGGGPERILHVTSACCPADPRNYELVLRLNDELTYAGIAVRDVNGRPTLVMTHSLFLSSATPVELRVSILEIARSSDWVRQQLPAAPP